MVPGGVTSMTAALIRPDGERAFVLGLGFDLPGSIWRARRLKC